MYMDIVHVAGMPFPLPSCVWWVYSSQITQWGVTTVRCYKYYIHVCTTCVYHLHVNVEFSVCVAI